MFVTTEVEVDLNKFESDDLLAELETRGYYATNLEGNADLTEIWELFRTNKPYEDKLREFFWLYLGRMA